MLPARGAADAAATLVVRDADALEARGVGPLFFQEAVERGVGLGGAHIFPESHVGPEARAGQNQLIADAGLLAEALIDCAPRADDGADVFGAMLAGLDD